ncbi:chitin synthase chs-2 isoform X5 [Cataglyphis hispanica]|uniref:chitin synthase chs-2 isoform X5 n=1 Tax=Cataglyphis hispanica TaxID=1086592 RepID=UPI00217FD52D|nr:chitin synthase chs-2 isoform X5 [Cataglyphis hispanica]
MAKNQHQNGVIPGGGTMSGPDDFSDGESTPLTQDYVGSQRTIVETKGWDVFRNPPLKTDSISGSMANQKCLERMVQVIKVLVYLLVFVIVLGSGVVAKGTILFMTSQLQRDRKIFYCNKQLDRENQYTVTLPEVERIAWIWCIIIAQSIPEFGALMRSIRMCIFKSFKKPQLSHFLLVFIMETFHVVGVSLMFMAVLPELDVVKGAMLTNCVCFVPGLLGLLSRNKSKDESKRFVLVLVDIAALAAQATSFVLWPLLENSKHSLWLIPVALFLVSCGWWENYVSTQSRIGLIRTLGRVKKEMRLTRYFTYMLMSIWKIVAFFISTILILHMKGENVGHLFSMLSSAFSEHKITVTSVKSIAGNLPDLSEIVTGDITEVVNADFSTPIYVLLLQIAGSYFAYIFGKFACKILIQGFSYAFPVNLTIPVSISLLIAACGLRNSDPCFFHGTIPDYLFYESPPPNFLNDFVSKQYAWVWLLWLLSQTWITLHIWTPKCERLAATEKLFVVPMYNSLLIDQSMGLNRRRDDQPEVKVEDLAEIEKEKGDGDYETIYEQTDGSTTPPSAVKSSDHVTRIYACATMWHENKEEMMEFLKSILRLDEDQCARRVAQKYLKVVDPDYYEFETHIFFDDAFELSDHDENESQVNRFVKLLVGTLDEAASDVHKTRMHVRAPKKYPTPYGGRLVWTLPGKTKMIAHLKDKSKIRHRKRWSQVMYMYYLLGHRLMELPISVDRKEVIAENTYLLTLDGDIDFQPAAVKLLVDLMKKNKNLGAACGRIHPVGSGPMVWYQMFEYAIGHWLQKATEHMIGCVLCSPGCFSLFRGKALMDDNVMKKYTTKSDEARHYVQYDQGEDRWLCTLLLQRGYRVEYSAASDAYTHAPEGFNEFYNQRRRWVPSTIANIMDLLMDAKRTIKINDNISLPYISYQILLMGGTILGPGTIFLMLVGAFVAAFKIDNWTSFYYNIIPILLFMIVCFTCKANVQELEQEKREAEEAKRKAKQKSLLGFLQNGAGTNDDDQGSIEISLAGLFKCLLCTHGKPSAEKQQLVAIAESLEQLGKRLETIERAVDPHSSGRRRASSVGSRTADHLGAIGEDPAEDEEASDTETVTSLNTEGNRDGSNFLSRPYWLNDDGLKKGEVDVLSLQEEQFWKDLLEKYLYPIDEDKAEKARIAADLIELRNKSVFAFLMFNALFVLIVFLLQLNKDQLHVIWPLGVKTNITYVEETSEVHITKEYLQLEPIGLVFVFFFALILVIQFTAMLFHRFGTLAHILASTSLDCCKKTKDLSEEALLSKHAVEIVRDLQRLDGMEGDYEEGSGSGPGRRKTIRNLEKSRRKTQAINTLDVAFRQRFFSMSEGAGLPRNMSTRRTTEAFKAFEGRRNSIMAQRRKSQMQTLGANNIYGVAGNPLGIQGRPSRSSQISVKDVFEGHGSVAGHVNAGYEGDDSPINSLRLQNLGGQVTWREANSNV